MTEPLEFPSAWLRLDEAAVALGVPADAAEMYSKTDAWRTAADQSGWVFAIEDVRRTALQLKSKKTPPILQTPKPDRRRGARPRWLFRGFRR